MGLQIGELVPKKTIAFKDLAGKVVAVDAYNVLYQFLTTIRQMDGTPLMDSKGRTTSHLSGVFYRFLNLLGDGIKPVFVFDGKVPDLKHGELAKRRKRKEVAQKKYEEAKEMKEYEEMLKFAKQTTRLTKEMAEESKKLIEALGIPVIQAPSEGEAQAAFMTARGDAYATISQDFDCLLFGAPLLIQNLTLAKKRKIATGYVEVRPEVIELKEVLSKLRFTQDQLIILGVLIGTDYNPGGYKGVGPKKAIDLIHTFKTQNKIFEEAEKLAKEPINFDPQEIIDVFKNIPTIKDYKLEFKKVDEEKVRKILIEEYEFGETRVNNALERLKKAKEKLKQQGLQKWF